MPRILITGASVAGPALAQRMAAIGWEVTVVERAPELRPEGQNIDVRGAGRDVLRWMGLEDALLAAGTGEVATEFVDEAGEVIAAFGIEEGDGDGPTAELEILRGDLARTLADAVPDGVRWRFGECVTALEQDGDVVHVTFAGGDRADYDVVAIAEGQGSTTRELVFTGVERHPLELYIAYATIPATVQDTDTWRILHAPGGRSVHLRPGGEGTTSAMLAWTSDERGLDELEPAAQVARIQEVFAGVGWEAPRIVAALPDADLYFEDLVQVAAPAWSDGRVVLLGDAAHCLTPLGGGGTSLALIDAHVLAQELDRHAEPAAACAAYEAFLRPTVERAQKLPPGVPRIAYPETKLGVRLLQAGERLAATNVVRSLAPSPTPAIDELELTPLRTDAQAAD